MSFRKRQTDVWNSKKEKGGTLETKISHGQLKEVSVQEIKIFLAGTICIYVLCKSYVWNSWRMEPVICISCANSVFML
jgi:hypothetical protein